MFFFKNIFIMGSFYYLFAPMNSQLCGNIKWNYIMGINNNFDQLFMSDD